MYSGGLEGILKDIQHVVLINNPQAEDELDSLLTWLNPNEQLSNHQMRPPTLRLKNGIKLLLNPQLDSDSEFVYQLQYLLRYYYIYQVKLHFFSSFDSMKTFKDIQRLERYYEFPLRHTYLFANNSNEWLVELNGLRHYLLNRNRVFRYQLKKRLRFLLNEDDFDLSEELIKWIDNANGSLSSRDIILDILVEKVSQFSETRMNKIWNQRFLTMETYNIFITKYWNQFATLLKCAEDDHNITNVVYCCFERQFLKIRSQEIFDICVLSYPDSKPTILELKKLLLKSNESTSIVVQFLSEFEKRVMNPSVTTVDALIAYVKTVKSFLTLDPTGRYLQSFTSFVNPYLQERSDLVIVLLYAILDLDSENFENDIRIAIDSNALYMLSKELRDPEFGIEGKLVANKRKMDMNSDAIGKSSTDDSSLLYKQVISQMLIWHPEATNTSSKKQKKYSLEKNLLDILLEIFENNDVFISEFLKLLTKKLLMLKFYKLDVRWTKCLKLLKDKFKINNTESSGVSTNIGDVGSSEFTYMNNIDVMLWDMKNSNELSERMHHIEGLDKRIQPKFISSLYWNQNKKGKASTSNYHIEPYLANQFEKYTKSFSQLKQGRTLHLIKDQGTIDLDFSFEDGRKISCEATFEQNCVINVFAENNLEKGFSLDYLNKNTKIELSRLKDILHFWMDQKVLYFDGIHYRTLEYIDQPEIIVQSMDNRNSTTPISSENVSNDDPIYTIQSNHASHTQLVLDKVWPYIKGMLTNLGSLNIEKIHSFLKVTVPKELSYNAITKSELEEYLNTLADEDVVDCQPNGLYKLNTKHLSK